MSPKLMVLALRRSSVATWPGSLSKRMAAVRAWMSSSRAKASMRFFSLEKCANTRSSTWE
jgi:hypothetical protein